MGWDDMLTGRTNEITVTRAYGLPATAAVLLGGLAALQPTLGQDSDTVTVDVTRCVALESAAARQACFGAQVDEVLEARGSSASADPSEAIEDTAADPNGSAEDETSSTPERDVEGAADDEYFGTISAIRERLPSSYVITLDNGQIWEQVEPKKYPLRPGLEVRIYPTKWGGSYRLSGVDSGGHIQVRRVQ